MKDRALALARRLNAGEGAITAVTGVGLHPDDVHGEDLGESLAIDAPDNDVIDLGWDDGTHYRVRRLTWRAPWQVEVMQRFNDDGSIESP